MQLTQFLESIKYLKLNNIWQKILESYNPLCNIKIQRIYIQKMLDDTEKVAQILQKGIRSALLKHK